MRILFIHLHSYQTLYCNYMISDKWRNCLPLIFSRIKTVNTSFCDIFSSNYSIHLGDYKIRYIIVLNRVKLK